MWWWDILPANNNNDDTDDDAPEYYSITHRQGKCYFDNVRDITVIQHTTECLREEF